MTTHRQVDEPSPTIVGPRPAEGAGGKMSIPQGLERLLTLAGISAEWRGRVLADPLAAAAEADIALSASEAAILKATPRTALGQMCDSFARRHGGVSLGRAAAGVAAAALLATGLVGCGERVPAPTGARPDVPPPAPTQEGEAVSRGIRPDAPAEAPPVLWMSSSSLDAALEQAKKASRAVMVVVPPGPKAKAPEPPPPPTRGISIDEPQVNPAARSMKVLLAEGREFRAAVRNANLLAVRLVRPVANPVDHYKEKAAFDAAVAAYEAALRKYGLDEQKLPTVVFLAPDGSELKKLVQPQEEAKLVEAVKAVPPLLAKWLTEQRRPEPAPPAPEGIRPDEPVTKGIRPDVPLPKDDM